MSTADKNHFKLNRSRKNLRRDVGRAIADFDMIQDGDLVMVCLSGGKDSYTLLDILSSLQRHAPINYELHAVNLDQKQPGFPEHVLPEYLENLGVTYKILEQDTYSIVPTKCLWGKIFVGFVHGYAGEFSINMTNQLAQIRSHWVITVMTLWKLCFSTCFMAAS